MLYEQTRRMNTPLVSGGLLDQPHIWLEEYAICMEAEEIHLAITTQMSNMKTEESIRDLFNKR